MQIKQSPPKLVPININLSIRMLLNNITVKIPFLDLLRNYLAIGPLGACILDVALLGRGDDLAIRKLSACTLQVPLLNPLRDHLAIGALGACFLQIPFVDLGDYLTIRKLRASALGVALLNSFRDYLAVRMLSTCSLEIPLVEFFGDHLTVWKLATSSFGRNLHLAVGVLN
jgi:hypothetical protein